MTQFQKKIQKAMELIFAELETNKTYRAYEIYLLIKNKYDYSPNYILAALYKASQSNTHLICELDEKNHIYYFTKTLDKPLEKCYN